MKITVITVCFNSIQTIEETIQSVLEQKFCNIEFLIIDGKSKDGTVDIIKKYALMDKRIKYISEPDDGIYNAMNKGIKIATGEYLFFLNAGDTFFSTDTLQETVKTMKKGYDIVYGKAMIISEGKMKCIKEKINRRLILRAAMICHQSMFIKTELMKKRGYQEEYKLCADREWLYWAYASNLKLKYINIIVCNYDGNGISSQKSQKRRLNEEREEILKKYFHKSYLIRKTLLNLQRKFGK